MNTRKFKYVRASTPKSERGTNAVVGTKWQEISKKFVSQLSVMGGRGGKFEVPTILYEKIHTILASFF